MTISAQNNGFSVKAYQGDARTLLAFNLSKAKTKNLAGFTVQYLAGGEGPFYLQNKLRFEDPSQHVQDATQPPTSSLNAPIHKFRWIHVPGSHNQGTDPFFGTYAYTVTPRYFDAHGSLQAIDPALGVTLKVDVSPFQKGRVALGFARGFMQSQAFVHHFGPSALTRPKDLLFDTSQEAGKNSQGETFTYADEYHWLGFTARKRVFDILTEALNNPGLTLDVFAYDLNEPDVLKIFLELAKQGRIRIILDNAALHSSKTKPTPEDRFEKLFTSAAVAPAEIKRGKFGRFAHDKELIVSDSKGPLKVLTGSTNMSVTGMYVNSNHVLVFDDRTVAKKYSEVFNLAWDQEPKGVGFAKSPLAAQAFSFSGAKLPPMEVQFSPHTEPVAQAALQEIADRVTREGKTKNGSVLFAVMDTGSGSGPVFPALKKLHGITSIFSYGITDTTDGIALYEPGKKGGVLVTGKPAKSILPPPFDQVPTVGLGHQVHHKFVICGFNTPDAVVYCGSSNLALGGEENNGDNLIAIHDSDIATVFAIEALGLVDHFEFLDRVSTHAKAAGKVPKKATAATVKAATKSSSKQHQAANVGWFLSTTSDWAQPYYDTNDLHCVDRLLFG
ncbi:phospholipase D-like domain-containing protein [Prosthecobacter sp.]|uniref:phospholipase D-like domain-containing protein n=1 Tax=Prosthecobacter sp. TaxID=1965333 RepID=UPI003783BCE4